MLNRENVKSFWQNQVGRDGIHWLPSVESLATLEHTKERAEFRHQEESKFIDRHFKLNQDDILIDLGAGAGQWSRHLAPRVKKVYAVELADGLIEIGKKLASNEGITNIAFISCPAEDFIHDGVADVVLISGLLCVLDDEQYQQVIKNIKKYLKIGGTVLLRESTSAIGIKLVHLNPKGQHSALYRTPDEIVNSFAKEGFLLKECAQFFEDDSILNRDPRGKLYYFNFRSIDKLSDQDHAQYYGSLGEEFLALKLYKEALSCYEKALEYNQDEVMQALVEKLKRLCEIAPHL